MPPKKRIISDMVPAQKPQKRPVAVSREEKPEPRYVKPETVVRSSARPLEVSAEKGLGSTFLWLSAVALFAGIIIAIGGLFSGATITLQPKVVEGAVDTNVIFSKLPKEGSVFFATATRTFDASEVVASTGVSGVDAAATGTVRFFNATASRITVPKNTAVVSTSSVVFLTDKAVTVPALSKEVAGEADAAVHAREVGNRGNIGLDNFTFEVENKTLAPLTIRSLTPMTGGTSSADAVADPAFVSAARDRVLARVSDKQVLLRRMREELPSSMIPLPIELPSPEPTVLIEPGYADGVHVSARQTVMLLMARRSDLADRIGAQLAAGDLVPLTIDSLDGLTVAAPAALLDAATSGSFQARVSGQVRLLGRVDAEAIQSKVLGQSKRAVRTELSNIPEIESFTIKMTPPWRRILPLDPLDTDIIVR